MEFTRDHEQELRDKFRSMADAPVNELRDMASALHVGLQVTDMVMSLTLAKDRMAEDGIGPEYQPMAVNQLRYKPTGATYQISVNEVDADSAAAFAEAMENAKPLEEGITRH